MSDKPDCFVRRPLYLVSNDLVGGYDLSFWDKPVSEHDFDEGERTVAWNVDVTFAAVVLEWWNSDG